MLSQDLAWLQKPHKDEEEGKEPGEWRLMLPRLDARLELEISTQCLTPVEKDSINTSARE